MHHTNGPASQGLGMLDKTVQLAVGFNGRESVQVERALNRKVAATEFLESVGLDSGAKELQDFSPFHAAVDLGMRRCRRRYDSSLFDRCLIVKEALDLAHFPPEKFFIVSGFLGFVRFSQGLREAFICSMAWR